MSKDTVNLDLVMEQLQTISAQQLEIKAMLNSIRPTETPREKAVREERPYNAKQIRDILIGANIMEQNQVTKSEALLNTFEGQVAICGNKTFMTVVSNVSTRIIQGGVKNKLGYFRTSMNKEIGN